MDEALFAPSIANRGRILYHDGEGPKWVEPNIPQGTLTSVGLEAPPEFKITSDPIKNAGNLSFESKEDQPRLFYATPPDKYGPMHLRPLSNSDLPIVDTQHGGTGSTEPLGDGLIVAQKNKIVSGPFGIGFLRQDVNGVLLQEISLEKAQGKLSRNQLADGVAVPDCTGQMAKILTNNGLLPSWTDRPVHSVQKFSPRQLTEGAARGYTLSLPKMIPGDCFELTTVFLVMQAESASEHYTKFIRIGMNEKQVEGIWTKTDGTEIMRFQLRLYRAADKIILSGDTFSDMWTLDFSKENVVEIFMEFDLDTPNAQFTPLLAKAILY